jgi:hypothetical protein
MRPQRWGREPGGRARSSLSPAAAFTRSAFRRPSARSARSRASASCFSRVAFSAITAASSDCTNAMASADAACHLRHASDVTARMRQALNHPGLDGVASVRYDKRYAGRALHGDKCGGVSGNDKEIDLIGDHSIHRIRKPLQPPTTWQS